MPLPIEHLSYSAFMCFMRNRYEFKRIYIDKQYRDKQGPALVVGKAFHKCMEMYYKGHPREQALEIGFMLIHDIESTIDFGVTGSLEKVLEDYRKTVEHFFQDGEKFIIKEQVVGSERTMKGNVEGIAVPVKAVADLVVRASGLELFDFKKVQSLSDLFVPASDSSEEEPKSEPAPVKPEYLIQAAFNYWGCVAELREIPTKMHFLEVKTSKNRDKTEPQCQIVTVDFQSEIMQRYMRAVKAMVAASLTLLADDDIKDYLFMPNVSDMMSGEDSWNDWLATQN